MLPSYAYTVLLSAVVSRASLAYSTLALPDGDHRNCDHYWWRNLLYISNMYPRQEQVRWMVAATVPYLTLRGQRCTRGYVVGQRSTTFVA